MSKNLKITIVAMVVALAFCVSAVAITIAVKKKGDDEAESTSVSVVTESGEELTEAPAPVDLSKDILGKWTDSSGMSGYEFFDNGTVNVTYVNLTIPVLNIPINGKATGTYSLNGSSLEINYSIYSGNIHMLFTASIEDNALTLIDLKDHNTYKYMRPSEVTSTAADSTEEVAPPAPSSDNPLVGSWKSSDESIEYIFFDNGTVSIKLHKKASVKEYSGVYIQGENDSLIIQYTAGGEKVTESFTAEISGLSMNLKNEKGDVTLFSKTAVESKSLLGKWNDSSGMRGYEFKENGVVEVTYINFTVPVVNIPINGTFTGSYSISGDKISIGYSVYSNSISNEYYYTVSGSTLKLVDVSDGDETTFIKVS